MKDMEVLVQLIERKNQCFRGFYQICDAFVQEIAQGNTENLEDFQNKRQGLITVLEQLDGEIKQLLASYDDRPQELDFLMTSELRTKMSYLFREKDSMVKGILDLDLQILSHIDRLKNETIARLQGLQTGKKTIGAYRSPIEKIENAEQVKLIDREV